jgi:hypothetical protein
MRNEDRWDSYRRLIWLHAQGENRKIDLVLGQPGPFREFCTVSTFGNHYGVTADDPELRPVGLRGVHGPAQPSEPKSQPLY